MRRSERLRSALVTGLSVISCPPLRRMIPRQCRFGALAEPALGKGDVGGSAHPGGVDALKALPPAFPDEFQMPSFWRKGYLGD